MDKSKWDRIIEKYTFEASLKNPWNAVLGAKKSLECVIQHLQIAQVDV